MMVSCISSAISRRPRANIGLEYKVPAGSRARFLADRCTDLSRSQPSTLVDEIVAGVAISARPPRQNGVARIFYTAIYTLAATFVFYGKEL